MQREERGGHVESAWGLGDTVDLLCIMQGQCTLASKSILHCSPLWSICCSYFTDEELGVLREYLTITPALNYPFWEVYRISVLGTYSFNHKGYCFLSPS